MPRWAVQPILSPAKVHFRIYYYNPLVPGDWVYWDALARNPSPLARDLWVIPIGNDAVGMAAVGTE